MPGKQTCVSIFIPLDCPCAYKTTWKITKCHKHHRVFIKGEGKTEKRFDYGMVKVKNCN